MKFHETTAARWHSVSSEPRFVSGLEYPPDRRLPSLGKLLSMANRIARGENEAHEDVRAWGAPSECHDDVARGAHREYLEFGKELEEHTGFTPEEIYEEAVQRVGRNSYHAYYEWFWGMNCLLGAICTENDAQANDRTRRRLYSHQAKRLP